MSEFEQQENERLKFEDEISEGKKLVEVLSRYVNYNKSTRGFIEAFKREHRTLQQSAFKMFLSLMEEIASENYQTDGRNKATKEVAETLLKGFKEEKVKQYIMEGVSEQRALDYVSGDGAKPSIYLPLI